MDASLAFVGTGAALGTTLGASLLGSRRAGTREARALALLLVLVSIAMLSITLRHGSYSIPKVIRLQFVDYVAALSAGPLLAGYVRGRAGRATTLRPLYLLHFVPAAAVGLHTLVTGSVILPFRAVMLVQMLYTGSCVYELVSARRRGVDGAELRWPARFVALAIVVHLAQLLRAMGFATQEFRNIVPITAIAALEILAIIACREAILAPRSPAKRPREPVACDDSELLATIDAAMRTNRLWSDAGLSLDGLASAVGSTPHRVSGALNASRGGFFEYVSSFRLEAARAALADPANDRYTIDAIAENAGFRSRSSFYAAFRKRFGITPSELRKARSLHDPSAPPASRRESGCPEAIR